jgi:DNA polymerase-3 subunit beta
MKFSIERAALLRALAHVQSVVERRNTIPILSNVLLKAEKGELSLSATDMDLEILETVPAEVSSGGATTAPAHTLYDIVRKLPDKGVVEFESSRPPCRSVPAVRTSSSVACRPKTFRRWPAARCRIRSNSAPAISRP